MIDIAQHIEYMLMYHDCVVVPGFGAFMLHEECARYDVDTCTFIPPTRTIGFNPEVRHNDAMLAGSISRRECVSIETARDELATTVFSMLHQLKSESEIPFGNLGTLTSGITPNSPVFTPSSLALSVRCLDCLPPIKVTLLIEEQEITAETSAAPVIVDIENEEKQPLTFTLPLKIVASIVAIMVGLGIFYSTSSLVNNSHVNFASLDSGISSRMEQTYDVDSSAKLQKISREILLNIARPAANTEIVQAATPTVMEEVAVMKTNPKPISTPGRYILVVGSFPSRQAAERHISRLGDKNLNIVEMDGKFRVFVSSASKIEDARKMAESMSTKYPDVWVCRR